MKKILVLFAALLTLGTVSACGGSDVTYRPAAYGENGHCYYVESPDEVYGLQRDHYCQSGWTPMLMPLYWHLMYAPYYSSPAYYGTFVPASSRTVFISHQTTFVNTHQTEIKSAVKTAKYKGSNGKTVPGSKFGTRTFTGGGKRGGFGGGSNRTCGLSYKGGTTGGGYGGGGSRGGYSSTSGGSRGGSSGGTRSTTGGSRTSTSGGTTKKTGGC